MDLIQIDENGLHLVFEKTEDFGCKLLHSTIGGSGGGGAELTDEARQIMAAYETYCARLNEYGQALFGELFPFCARENCRFVKHIGQ